ncbi:MAG TPA: PIN domain-containing protein [Thermoanaerobaculia bacterium]
MILLDTGPFVALFDPRDHQHRRCDRRLQELTEPLATTVPVLVEAFHILGPASFGARRLREFLRRGGVRVVQMDASALNRAYDLMDRYADHPMDLADASLIVAAELLPTRKIFTLDRSDFSTYRIQRGKRHEPVEIVS